jgi:molybdopterin synthase catalytic subunit
VASGAIVTFEGFSRGASSSELRELQVMERGA